MVGNRETLATVLTAKRGQSTAGAHDQNRRFERAVVEKKSLGWLKAAVECDGLDCEARSEHRRCA